MGSIKGIETLKTKREFDLVYKKGKAQHSPFFVIFYYPSNGMKVGFVASKKVGKAVQRNRAKRLLRALFIASLDRFQKGHYVFVAKHAILGSDFHKLKKLLDKMVGRLYD